MVLRIITLLAIEIKQVPDFDEKLHIVIKAIRKSAIGKKHPNTLNELPLSKGIVTKNGKYVNDRLNSSFDGELHIVKILTGHTTQKRLILTRFCI